MNGVLLMVVAAAVLGLRLSGLWPLAGQQVGR